jgi:hypothetical protein
MRAHQTMTGLPLSIITRLLGSDDESAGKQETLNGIGSVAILRSLLSGVCEQLNAGWIHMPTTLNSTFLLLSIPILCDHSLTPSPPVSDDVNRACIVIHAVSLSCG